MSIQPLPAPSFCDSVIVLHMIIDGYEGNGTSLVKDTRTVLLDKALLRRSAIAIGSAFDTAHRVKIGQVAIPQLLRETAMLVVAAPQRPSKSRSA
jgi:hypothetical protein